MGENSDTVFECLERSREALSLNPFDISLYEKAIKASKFIGDLDTLRTFRSICYEYCSVDENFWLEYIEDERRYLGSTGRLKEEVIKLKNIFEIAVVNCPSFELWNGYAKFLIEIFTADNQDIVALSDIRNVYERSLEALGLHALDGPSLWASYRQFESSLLTSQLIDKNAVMSFEQVKRVRNLFLRQLELPLGGLPDLLDEYRVWEEDLPQEYKQTPAAAEAAHRIGHLAWEARKGFEMKAQSEIDEIADPFALEHVWTQYIMFEKSQRPSNTRLDCVDKNWVSRVAVTYHRALEYLGFARWDLWIEYIEFCLTYLSDPIKSLNVSKRACRHLPKVLSLWILQAQILVNSGADLNEIIALICKASLALGQSEFISDILISVSEISPKLGDELEKIYITREEPLENYLIGSGILKLKINHSIPQIKNLQSFLGHLLEQRAGFDNQKFWHSMEKLISNGVTCPKTWSNIARGIYKYSSANTKINEMTDIRCVDDKSVSDFIGKLKQIFGNDMTIACTHNMSCDEINAITLVDLPIIVYKIAFKKLLELNNKTSAEKDIKSTSKRLMVDFLIHDFVRFAKEIKSPRALQVARRMSSFGIQNDSAKGVAPSFHWLQLFRMKRYKRRRRLESESENSSDCSQGGSKHVRYLGQTGWYESPCISPVLRSRSASPETSGSGSPSQPLSPIIAPRQVERVTRATWFGKESVEPSLAPAVIPSKDDQDHSQTDYRDIAIEPGIELPSNMMGEMLNKSVSINKYSSESQIQRNTLFVTNVSIGVTSLDIARHVLSCGCEGLVDVRLGKPRSGQQVTFAYVEFMGFDAAKVAKSKLNKTLLLSLPLIVQMSRPKKNSPAYMPNTLFCSTFNVSIPLVKENQGRIKDSILKLVPNSTTVVTIRLVLNFENQLEFKNYCYIDFATSSDATKALSLNLMEQLISTPELILSRSLYSEKTPY